MFKERGTNSNPGVVNLYYQRPVGGPTMGPLPQTGVGDTDYESTTGYPTLHYFRRMRGGELLPPTQYSEVRTLVTGSQTSFNTITRDGTTEVQWGSGPYRLRSQFPSWGGTIPNNQALLTQRALDNLVNQGTDILTMLAEFPQSYHMVVNAIATMIRLVKNPLFWKLKDLLPDRRNRWEDSWLAYRYGWRTLYYDIVAIIKLFRKKKNFRVAIGKSDMKSVFQINTTSVTTPYGMYDMRRDIVGSVEVSERVKVYSKTIPPRFVVDPVMTAWELTRLSFVVDWFVDFGAWLASLKALTLHRDLVGSYSVRVTHNVDDHWFLQENPVRPWTGYYDESCTYLSITTNRTPITPTASLPQIDLNFLNFERLRDLLAILAQSGR